MEPITQQDILLVAGGFHLLMDDASSIRKKAERLKQLGVRNVAPSHCSGGEAIGTLAEIFGSRFLKSGAGRIIRVSDFALPESIHHKKTTYTMTWLKA